jgi:diadenosine tetraphosphate (Ap4A) HIT family hydrolase/pimeloyl-ACP methyl ester carboxylesterase
MGPDTRRPPASLLLVHGAGSGPWVYEGWAESFPGLIVAAIDLHEGLDVGQASHDDYARQVAEAAAGLPQPVALCGWSMGGLVALQACRYMPPHSVVLIEASPPAEILGARPETPDGNGTFDPEPVYGPFPAGMRARPESARARAERMRGITIPTVPCRSLVVYGDEFPTERGTELARLYGSDELAFPELDHWGLVLDRRVRWRIAEWLGLQRPRRRRVDFGAIQAALEGRCFICETVAGSPGFRHHVVYEDDAAVAFLNRYPALLGHVLVAPKEHREHVTADFGEEEYLALQAVVRRVGEAVRQAVPAERLYVLSLGSQEANRHVHWHVAPLPPGVPLEEQQLAALGMDCVLDLDDAEMADLAERIRSEIDGG